MISIFRQLTGNIFNFVKKNWLFLTVLALGFLLRIIKTKQLFMYAHDQDLASWIIKDVLINKHFRLIGQQTSILGVFIGPLYYYLLIPFYFAFNLDPIGGIYMVIILGVGSIVSFYYVFSSVFNRRVGLIASLIYAISFIIVMTDREVVPTMPVMLWSVWYFYAVIKLLRGDQKKGFVLLGLLAGLVWHLNLALVLLMPLVPVAFFMSRKKVKIKYLGVATILIFIFNLPFIVFESRHGYQQIKAITNSLSAGSGEFPGGVKKFDWIINIISKNVFNLFVNLSGFPAKIVLYSIALIFILLLIKKVMEPKIGFICLLWLTIYIVYFSVSSIIPSEYYFNGMAVIWILIVSLFIDWLLMNGRFRYIGFLLLIFFVINNIYKFYSMDVNRIGYIQKKELVSYIKADAETHGYPCVAVSYITNPGYELGYRYLFWLEDMHINQSLSGSPVYSIVFPHSIVDRIDRSFGALGLVLPDYEKYTKDEVIESCSGDNSNLTDPMFGYTE